MCQLSSERAALAGELAWSGCQGFHPVCSFKLAKTIAENVSDLCLLQRVFRGGYSIHRLWDRIEKAG